MSERQRKPQRSTRRGLFGIGGLRVVRQHDAVGAESLGVRESQKGWHPTFGEVALASSLDDRIDPDPVLVDQAACSQRVGEIGAGQQQDVSTGPLLELGDLLATSSEIRLELFHRRSLSVVDTTYFRTAFM